MKQIYINKHRCGCHAAEGRKHDPYSEIKCQIRTDVFFVSPYFFIVNINSCLQDPFESNVDFNLRIVTALFEKFSIVDYWDLYKSCKKETMQKFRLISRFKTMCKQVNYLYQDNAGKDYGIVTETSYFDVICDNDIIRNSYHETLNKLKELNESDGVIKILLHKTDQLMLFNQHHEDDIQIVRTTDHLIDYINKLTNYKINGNDKKSKLPRVVKTHI
jgi:hypothetical protein